VKQNDKNGDDDEMINCSIHINSQQCSRSLIKERCVGSSAGRFKECNFDFVPAPLSLLD
jgi:hypothetical protein